MTAARIGTLLRPLPLRVSLLPRIQPLLLLPYEPARAAFATTGRRMAIYTGSCYCGEIKYELTLGSPDDGRTSLCHCRNCKVCFCLPPARLLLLIKSAELQASPNVSGEEVYGELMRVSFGIEILRHALRRNVQGAQIIATVNAGHAARARR